MRRKKIEEKIYDLPDLLEFLNLSRKIIVQIDILKGVDVPEELKKKADGAIKKIHDSAAEYINIS